MRRGISGGQKKRVTTGMLKASFELFLHGKINLFGYMVFELRKK